MERYRLLDYEATKAALEDLAEKEWPRARRQCRSQYRGKGLQLEFSVDDNGAFTMPWSATITYPRRPTQNGMNASARRISSTIMVDAILL